MDSLSLVEIFKVAVGLFSLLSFSCFQFSKFDKNQFDALQLLAKIYLNNQNLN